MAAVCWHENGRKRREFGGGRRLIDRAPQKRIHTSAGLRVLIGQYKETEERSLGGRVVGEVKSGLVGEEGVLQNSRTPANWPGCPPDRSQRQRAFEEPRLRLKKC